MGIVSSHFPIFLIYEDRKKMANILVVNQTTNFPHSPGSTLANYWNDLNTPVIHSTRSDTELNAELIPPRVGFVLAERARNCSSVNAYILYKPELVPSSNSQSIVWAFACACISLSLRDLSREVCIPNWNALLLSCEVSNSFRFGISLYKRIFDGENLIWLELLWRRLKGYWKGKVWCLLELLLLFLLLLYLEICCLK